MKTLTDGKDQVTTWNYDEYGRATNKVDATSTEIFRYAFDPDGRLTNRWTAAKGNTVYGYDLLGNLTDVDYAVSPDLTMQYDALNRLTSLVDAVGTNVYTYDAASQLLSEDGPWASDAITYTYANRLRSSLTLQQPTGSWTNGYLYDAAKRLTNITSLAGAFGYAYEATRPALVSKLTLPNTKWGQFLVLTTPCPFNILASVARKLRVEYPGAIYHVMNRGDRREAIFKDEQDRQRFLETLAEVCAKTGWQVHALCLMANHFHLVVETPQGNLVAGMKWFLGTYTSRFNRRHKLFGHLFSGRYKALVVDGSGNGYLKTVCDYVHLNPARAKLLKPEQALNGYRWSSWPEYLKSPGKRWPWLRVDRLLGEYRIPKDSAAGRQALQQALEERRTAEAGADYKAIRRGWCLGEKSFRKELLAQMTERIGAEHYGAERMETDVEKAERIVGEELKARRWKESDLEKRSKGDPGKVKIAARLREESLATVKWIAARLGMGTASYLNNRLYRWRKGTLAGP